MVMIYTTIADFSLEKPHTETPTIEGTGGQLPNIS